MSTSLVKGRRVERVLELALAVPCVSSVDGAA